MIDWVCEIWDQPDEGIWETRGGRKDFTYGPFQTWVALDRADPMWISTLEAMDRELVSDSLVYRYNPAASPDGLAGDEGTFSLCTFWYVDALARAGRLDEARLTFEKMHTYANHLGLYSEEIGTTGEQLGNFPQGVQPPGADQRRNQPGLPARPRRRDGRACPITGALKGRCRRDQIKVPSLSSG